MYGAAGDRVQSTNYDEIIRVVRSGSHPKVIVVSDSTLDFGKGERGRANPSVDFSEFCTQYGLQMEPLVIQRGLSASEFANNLIRKGLITSRVLKG